MKKMFAKLGMPSLLSLAFLLGGLLFGASSAQAQTTLIQPAGASSAPIKITGSWKSVADAKTALNAEIAYLDNTLSNGGATPQLKMKLTIYKGIVQDLELGVEVPVATFDNYYAYSPKGPDGQDVDSKPATPGLNTSDWTNLYNDMLGVVTL